MKIKDGDIIVFAGDATTDADKNATNDRLGNGYVKLVRDALFAFRPSENFRVVNAGVSGNTTVHLLERWEKDVASLDPDVVFCLIGINDVWRHFDYLDPLEKRVNEEDYEKNIEKICEMAKGAREFCLMTPFYMERSRVDEMRDMTEKYAARMRAVAQKRGIKVIDLQKVFDEYMKGRPGQSISWDRVHPGSVGSMLIAREILREFGEK